MAEVLVDVCVCVHIHTHAHTFVIKVKLSSLDSKCVQMKNDLFLPFPG